MCGNCRAVEVNVDWYSAGVGESLAERRKGRVALASAAESAMQHLGLRAKVYPGALGITLQTRQGSRIIVSNLGDLQSAVRELIGQHWDPLEEAQIAIRLSTAGASEGAES